MTWAVITLSLTVLAGLFFGAYAAMGAFFVCILWLMWTELRHAPTVEYWDDYPDDEKDEKPESHDR